MLYRLVRPVARYVLDYYFDRIELEGLEHIPADAAVILAANHPTAFIEPCILACYQGRPLHFLARGDLYKNKLATMVLRALNILPVYRLEDGGYGKLRQNYDTFDACYRVLSRKKCLMILAEGRCIHEKQLRPLRKGTARIALGALDRDPTLPDVYVVPVGVNFTAADRLRSTVLIRCGAPLRAADYLEAYRKEEAATIRDFTADLRTALSAHVLQFPDPELADAGEVMLEVARNEWQGGRGIGGSERVGRGIVDGEAVVGPGGDAAMSREDSRMGNHASVEDMRSTSQLAAEMRVLPLITDNHATARAYGNLLRVQKVNDLAIKNEITDGVAPVGLWWRTPLAGLLLLPQLPGWALAQWIAKHFPATIEFYSPVRFAAIAVATILFLPILLLLPWPGKIYLLLSLVGTNWAVTQVQNLRHWSRRRRVAQLVPAVRKRLIELRGALTRP